MSATFELRDILEILGLLVAVAGAFGVLRATTESNKKHVEATAKKLDEATASISKKIDDERATLTKKIEDGLRDHATTAEKEFRERDVTIQSLMTRAGQFDVRLATIDQSHSALHASHAALAGELRNRMTSAENRVQQGEQSWVEARAEMKALSAAVARVEVKQDEIMMSVLSSGKPKRTR